MRRRGLQAADVGPFALKVAMRGPAVPTKFRLFNLLKMLGLNSDGQGFVVTYTGYLILCDLNPDFVPGIVGIAIHVTSSLHFLTKHINMTYLLGTQMLTH